MQLSSPAGVLSASAASSCPSRWSLCALLAQVSVNACLLIEAVKSWLHKVSVYIQFVLAAVSLKAVQRTTSSFWSVMAHVTLSRHLWLQLLMPKMETPSHSLLPSHCESKQYIKCSAASLKRCLSLKWHIVFGRRLLNITLVTFGFNVCLHRQDIRSSFEIDVEVYSLVGTSHMWPKTLVWKEIAPLTSCYFPWDFAYIFN